MNTDSKAQIASKPPVFDSFEQVLKWLLDDWCGMENANPLWFRGCRRSSHALLPSLFRRGAPLDRHLAFQMFRGMGMSRRPNAPAPDSIADWMVIARHHGFPTPLLDWTHSFLAALWFASNGSDHDSRDGDASGRIWAIDPLRLNERVHKKHGIPFLSTEICVQYFGSQPGGSVSGKPMAVFASESDDRIRAQSGVFTIHSDDTLMEDDPSLNDLLTSCVVNLEGRRSIANALRRMGFMEGLLFPDLDALARYTVELADIYVNRV